MNRIKNTDVFTSIKDQSNLPRYFRRIFKILSNLDIGSIEVKQLEEIVAWRRASI